MAARENTGDEFVDGNRAGANPAGKPDPLAGMDAASGRDTARPDYSNLGEQLQVGPSDRRALTNRLRANAGLFGLMAFGLLAIIVGGVLLANVVSSW